MSHDRYVIRRKDGEAVCAARTFTDAQAAMQERRKDKGFERDERVGLVITIQPGDR